MKLITQLGHVMWHILHPTLLCSYICFKLVMHKSLLLHVLPKQDIHSGNSTIPDILAVIIMYAIRDRANVLNMEEMKDTCILTVVLSLKILLDH